MRAESLFGMSDVLGLNGYRASLVLDGHLYRLTPIAGDVRQADMAHVFGVRRQVRLVGALSDLQAQFVKTQKEKIAQYRKRIWGTSVASPDVLDTCVQLHSRLRFVVNDLIPHFRSLVAKPEVDPTANWHRVSATSLDGLARGFWLPPDLVEKALGGHALFLGQNVLDVHPARRSFGRNVLRVGGEYFTVGENGRPLMNVDMAFRKALAAVLGGGVLPARQKQVQTDARQIVTRVQRLRAALGDHRTLYRDCERSVILDGQDRLFCCLHVPSFVLEAADRSLRRFPAVDVGVELASLAPEVVLAPNNVHTMGPYVHPFVSQYANHHLCLGGDSEFYLRFRKLPLQAGIAAFLDAARRVLCAGFFEGMQTVPYNSEAIYTQPEISPKEAVSLGLPVYRYYRKEAA